MNQPLIDLVHISKSFDGTMVLDDLNLSVKENEFVTLLGPSGCGKTTTLRIIGGFETADTGKVIFDGTDISKLPPNKRQLNTVFQKYALFTHMSIAENIAFGLKIKGKSKDYINDKIKYALKLVNLDGYEKRSIDSLSGGQQQRIAIARAIVNEPRVLLLDEPLGALDLKLRQDMQYELIRLKNELGITFIYVTHDQTEALTMSTKIAIFFEGVLEQVAPPMELYQNPASLRVADFIGNPKVNFLPGKARVAGDTMTVESVLGTAAYDRKYFTGEAPGDGSFEAVVGVRPELVEILDGPAEGSIEAEVYSVMPAGSETTIYLEVGGERILSKQNGLKQYSPDQKVWLRINPDKMNVFCKDSGRLAKLAVMDAQQD